jgi:hypothetical protein
MTKLAWAAAAAALLGAGCGYVGDTLPPLLNVPASITDLAAVERGDKIIVQFSVPHATTEGAPLKRPPRLELRAGEAASPFNASEWAPRAKELGPVEAVKGRVRFEFPVNGWAGKDIVVGVRAISARDRDAGWSNFAVLNVVPPPAKPSSVHPENVREGVRVSWQAPGALFRIYRRAGEEKEFSPVGDAPSSPYADTHTQYGTLYSYRVRSIVKTPHGEAESDPSEDASITPLDVFAPAAPTGLTLVASTASIELAWESNTDADLAGYIVYRAPQGGDFQKLAGPQQAPSYSDRKIEAGKSYRYAVSAVDGAGNESPRSAPADAAAQ